MSNDNIKIDVLDFFAGGQNRSVDVSFNVAARSVIFETTTPRATMRAIPFDATVVLPQGDRAAFSTPSGIWATPLPVDEVNSLFHRIESTYPRAQPG